MIEIVSGMAFPEVRQEMRENQNLLYKNTQDANGDSKGCELISFKKPNKFSQVKMNHLNKVAPTASPLLSKTPKRVNNIKSYLQLYNELDRIYIGEPG